jgi:hypothetical protein
MEPESSLPQSQVPATCSNPVPDQSNPYPHHVSRRSILILPSHLHLGVLSGLFPSGFPTKTLYTPLPNTRYMPRLSHFSRFDYPKDIEWGVKIIKLLIM